MTDTPGENIRIRRHRIPGRGSRYEIPLQDGHHLVIVSSNTTEDTRQLHVLPSEQDDQPTASIELTPGEATTIATLLSNVRLVIEEPSEPPRGVQVETMQVGGGSQAIGKRPDELPITEPDHARILAVIRDDTPELVEADTSQACRPGDRLVVAGRPPHIDSLRRYLL
jgi:K+/H+ antiporter YhaU regulatory subunit KhtT